MALFALAGVKIGDIIRMNLSKGPGFSKEDRDTNIRRIGFVCELLTRNDVVAIAAAISPYREARDEVRNRIGSFIEIYVKCPLEVLSERDVKGLYKKALSGEIENFTGVDDPYEEPLSPEIVIHTNMEKPEDSARRIIARLESLNLIEEIERPGYSEEEELGIQQRLEALGYL